MIANLVVGHVDGVNWDGLPGQVRLPLLVALWWEDGSEHTLRTHQSAVGVGALYVHLFPLVGGVQEASVTLTDVPAQGILLIHTNL